MPSSNVDISYSAQFGSKGTGNGQFKYPHGMCVLNDILYVVDRQNHRIQYFDLDGNYLGEFGGTLVPYGDGNDEFYFPEYICTDGFSLFITDSGNHRVKKHTATGVFITKWGTLGTGTSEFNYPAGITFYNGYIYVVDRQNHRVQMFDTNGLYYFKFGQYGVNSYNLNFPDGITVLNGNLAINDSANDAIKIWSWNGTYLNKTTFGIGYLAGISLTNDVLTAVDRENSKFYVVDTSYEKVTEFGSYGTGDNELNFPIGAAYADNKLYISDSASHRIKIYNFSVELGLYFKTALMGVTRQLYPTGRAFWLIKNSIFAKIHEALALSESRLYQKIIDIKYSIIPDNDFFTTENATDWERVMGLPGKGTLAERKDAILRKMSYPNNILARQFYLFMQDQLQLAGFDVYVHENRFAADPIIDEQLGVSELGEAEMGGTITNPSNYEVIEPDDFISQDEQLGISELGEAEMGGEITGLDYKIIANHIKEADDDNFFDPLDVEGFGELEFGISSFGGESIYSRIDKLKETFFIGGSGFPSFASVSASRKNEFRELILKLKPAQMVGFLYINYV